jgi:hypothetical protein
VGTNFYLRLETKPPCACCGRGYEVEPLHIGKSSGGWCFSLHVDPEAVVAGHQGINDLHDWQELWAVPGARIEDEYGEVLTPEEMLERITDRGRDIPNTEGPLWYSQNNAEPGPNNLARHRIDYRHCIGHGAGTWDLITGEFS